MTWTELLNKTSNNPLWAASQLAALDERIRKLSAAISEVIDTDWLAEIPPRQAE